MKPILASSVIREGKVDWEIVGERLEADNEFVSKRAEFLIAMQRNRNKLARRLLSELCSIVDKYNITIVDQIRELRGDYKTVEDLDE